MFCPKCGQSLPDGAVFCPACGSNMSTDGVCDTPCVSPLDNIKKTLSNPLFLAIAVLLSVAAGTQMLFASFNILLILIVIGMWIAYAGATGENTSLIGNGISLASVSVKIEYILVFVGAGLIIFGGLLLFVAFSFIGNSLSELSNLTYDTLVEAAAEMGITFDAGPIAAKIIDMIFHILGSFSGMVIGLFFLIVTLIASGIMILFNLLFAGRFSKFLSSTARACKDFKPVEIHKHPCAGWILAYGIYLGLETLSTFGISGNVFSLISGGCLSASCIIAFVLMRKEA